MICGCTGGDDNWTKMYDLKEVKYIPVKKDGHYLYINSDGEEVIPAKFNYADIFRNGLALVKDTAADLYGYINTKGDYQIVPKYKSATIFSNDIAWVAEPDSGLKAIDKKGKILFALPEAETAGTYSEGIAPFRNSRNKWGCIDKKGKILIKPQYRQPVNFLNGKAVVETDKGVMVINKKGKVLIEAGEYKTISPSKNGSTCYIISSGGKYGLVNEKNKFIINPQYDKLFFDGEDLLVFKNDKGKIGWCNRKGKVVIKAKYEDIAGFGNEKLSGYSISNGKYGFIDRKGKIKINAKYDNASYFYEGKAFIKKDGKWGIINEEGDIIAEPQFEVILPPIGKVLFAKSGGKYGIINDEGKYIVNPKYDEISKECFSPTSTLGENNYFNSESFANFTKDWIEQLFPEVTLGTLMEKYNIAENSVTQKDDLQLEYYYSEFGYIVCQANLTNNWITESYHKPKLNKDVAPSSYRLHIFLRNGEVDKGIEIEQRIRKVFGINENNPHAIVGKWMVSINEPQIIDKYFSLFLDIQPHNENKL